MHNAVYHRGTTALIDMLHDTLARALSVTGEAWTQVSALATAHPVVTFQTFAVASIFVLNRAGSAG